MEIFFAYYTVGALASFSVCFKAFVKDSTTPLTDQTSWGVLALTSVFWPITIPISWLELVTKSQTSIAQSSGSVFSNHFYQPQSGVINPSPSPSVQPLPKRVNDNQPRFLPLGYLLRQAGLVTEFQIKVALKAQKTHLNHLRLGEILVHQGLIEPETIEFFVEHLPTLHQHSHKKTLGEYLKMAKLLDDQQINQILTENPQTNLKFGELAVQNGWVKQDTINLVLHYLGDQPQKVIKG